MKLPNCGTPEWELQLAVQYDRLLSSLFSCVCFFFNLVPKIFPATNNSSPIMTFLYYTDLENIRSVTKFILITFGKYY